MGYADTLHEQAKLIKHWTSADGTWDAGHFHKNFGHPDGNPEQFRRGLVWMLRHAAPYYVHPGICDVAQAATDSYPAATIEAADFPEPVGFLLFARALPFHGYTPEELPTLPLPPELDERPDPAKLAGIGLRALLWHSEPAAGRGTIFFFSSHDGWRGFDALHLLYGTSCLHGRQGWADIRDRDPRQEEQKRAIVRTLQGLFAFLRQRVLATSTRAVVNKGARRRLAKTFDHEPLVRVVDLRLRDYQQRDESHGRPVAWSCQWLVRGHWHGYHTREGLKPRWVAPYVKGDPAKPLKPPRAVAYEAVR